MLPLPLAEDLRVTEETLGDGTQIEIIGGSSDLRRMIPRIADVFAACSGPNASDAAEHVESFFSFEPPATHRLLVVIALDASVCAGVIIGFVDHTLGHPQLQEPTIMVLPSHRRRGIGRRLVMRALESMSDPESTIVASSHSSGSDAFAKALGAVVMQRTVHSALAAEAVDAERLSVVAAAAPSGYVAMTWDGLAPMDVADEFVGLFSYLRTAPNGEEIPIPATIDEQREWASSFERNGWQWWTATARVSPTGQLAAMTDLQVRPDGTASVLHTVTHPAHRGRGLARWLKALLLTRFFVDHGGRLVVTQNASTNEAAIRSNRSLGMREAGITTGWVLRGGAG